MAYAVPHSQSIQQNQKGQDLVLAPTWELVVHIATNLKNKTGTSGSAVPAYGVQRISVFIDRLEDQQVRTVVASPDPL